MNIFLIGFSSGISRLEITCSAGSSILIKKVWLKKFSKTTKEICEEPNKWFLLVLFLFPVPPFV